MRPALLLAALMAGQLTLGAFTVWSGRAVMPTTFHVLMGAMVLATTFVITMRAHVLFAPDRQEGKRVGLPERAAA